MGAGDSAGIFFGWGKRGKMAGKPGGKCGMYALGFLVLTAGSLTAVIQAVT